MDAPDLGTVVAERLLYLVGADGATTSCTAKIGMPVLGENGDWVCPYEIETGDRVRRFRMYGIDSMQALVLTQEALDAEISSASEKLGARVVEVTAHCIEVDECILRHVQRRWQKVAMIVAKVLGELDPDYKRLSDVGIATRVKELVRYGLIESQGNLDQMRRSEIRLHSPSE